MRLPSRPPLPASFDRLRRVCTLDGATTPERAGEERGMGWRRIGAAVEGQPLPGSLPVESLPVGSDPGLREGHL